MEVIIPYFEEFDKYYTEHNSVQERTLEDYHSVLSSFYSFLILQQKNYLEPIHITPGDIYRYISYMKEKELKPTTINKHISKIKGYFDYLERIGKVAVDPAAKVKRLELKTQRKWVPIELIRDIQQEVISNISVNTMDKVIIILAANGVRGPEMVSSEFARTLTFSKNDVTIHLANSTIVIPGIAAEYVKELYDTTQILRESMNVQNLFFMKKRRIKNRELTPLTEQYYPIDTIDIAPRMNRLSKKLNIEFTLKAIELGWIFYKLDTTPFENISALHLSLGISEVNFKTIMEAYKIYKTENNTK